MSHLEKNAKTYALIAKQQVDRGTHPCCSVEYSFFLFFL